MEICFNQSHDALELRFSFYILGGGCGVLQSSHALSRRPDDSIATPEEVHRGRIFPLQYLYANQFAVANVHIDKLRLYLLQYT